MEATEDAGSERASLPQLPQLEEGDGCCNLERTVVEEAEEIASIVQRIVDSQGDQATALLPRWKAILSKYQEQSELLDALLESIVTPLAALLRLGLSAGQDSHACQRVVAVCRVLNVLVTVRGYKTVVRFFPHHATDLEAVLALLVTIKALPAPTKAQDEEQGLALWEAQAILLLWLSMLILLPFDLATLDSSETASADPASAPKPYTQLVSRVLGLCQEYLRHPGVVRDMAALLLGRLLTRPDMGAALREVLGWSQQQLKQAGTSQSPDTVFLVAGVLQTLCVVFKLGQRATLRPHAAQAWAQLASLMQQQTSANSSAGVLARKLSIKLTQRVALTFLTPRLAPWRYQRDDCGGDLDLRLGGAAGGQESVAVVAAEVAGAGGAEDDDVDEEFELAEEVEEVIEVLLTALRDKDTVVRWSAAKGVGRVTGCLPYDLGDEVVENITTMFKPTETDAAWHGGCLALAELARRGLLLPNRLTALTPAIQQALLYDVRRGPHSIGAHVRDAAAYVCWAFARAYAPAAMAPCVHVLASTLLTVACYDREVNCRRAAAAAFQECVGRLGNFPHGIDLMGVADYFAVGNLNNAYLHVAVQVAQYPEYQRPLATHLLHTQLRHWDKQLRELTARALAALVVREVGRTFLCSEGLGLLLPWCLDTVLEVRHGAVVGVSELLPALHRAGLPLSPAHAEQVANLVPSIDKARLYRGKGGEVLREAVSKLIRGVSKVHLPLTAAQHTKVLEALDENLRSPQSNIQHAAVVALSHYTRAYLDSLSEGQNRFLRYYDAFLTRLHDVNVAVRRGYALALGALPAGLLLPRAEEVIDALIAGTVVEEDPDERDTQGRANCVAALMRVCSTLYGDGGQATGCGGEDGQQGAATASGGGEEEAGEGEGVQGASPVADGVEVLLDKVLPSYHNCLRDYTLDARGDVGSWVREVAMQGLTRALHLLVLQLRTYPPSPDVYGGRTGDQILAEVVPEAVAALLKQAVERIAKMREGAMQHLRYLTTCDTAEPAPADDPTTSTSTPTPTSTANRPTPTASDSLRVTAYIPAADQLRAALPTDDAVLQGVTSLDAVPRLSSLMQACPVYRLALLEGLVSSVGGVDAQLTKVASAALLDQLAGSGSSTAATAEGLQGASFAACVAGDFVRLWREHAKSVRMARPLLRTADLLATRCPELCTVHVPTPAATSSTGAPTQPASSQQQGGDAASSSTGSLWCNVVVELARAETRMCADVPRLMDAAVLLSHLVTAPQPARTSAYQGLLVLLANKYPKVRRYTAEQLYLALLPLDPEQVGGSDQGVDAATLDSMTDLLLTTAWDGTLDTAKTARDQLAGLLGVAVPAMKAAGPRAQQANSGTDEYASYQSLLNDTARGL